MKRTILTALALSAALGTAAVAESAKPSQAGGMTHGAMIKDFNKTESANWASSISGLTGTPDIEIVKLSELKGEGAENSAALDKALTDTASDAGAARAAIEANAELKGALEAESFTSQDVVAVQVEGSNQVTLVVDDRA